MSNSDGSGDVLDIELLRSPKWIEESGCQVGASIGLAVPELGIAGWARVLAVEPCPKLQTGSGRVVTMTITHFNSFVLQFKLEGLSEVLEPTQTHPLYSEDRGGWVHAGELKVGERLRTKTGPARIEAISHKEGTYRVYNFEVEETHAYYTSDIRVLSHNTVGVNCGPKGYSRVWEHQLDPADLGKSAATHKARSAAELLAQIKANPEFAAMMEEVAPGIAKDLEAGFVPKGYRWHHAHSKATGGRMGVMQLVPEVQHTKGSPFYRNLHPGANQSGGYKEWAEPAGAPCRSK